MTVSATVARQLVPLPAGAYMASLDYHALRKLVIRGVIEGELRGGRWYVDLQSLTAHTREPLRPLPSEAADAAQ